MREMMPPGGPEMPARPQGPVIKDGTEATFMKDVAEASMSAPVIVDFWADWCGPCKQLTPILEKLVMASKAPITLVKIDADRNQRLCQQLRVQSLPTVMAFVGGRPVDGFAGALPESQVKQFIDRMVAAMGPGPSADLLKDAQELLAEGDPASAAALFAEIAQEEPENGEALGGLVQCYLALGEVETAAEILAATPAGARKAKAWQAADAAIALARQAADAGDANEFLARLEADANDHEARFELARAYLARNQREKAADELLTLFSKDREWNEGAARKQLVQMFEAAGPTDPFTLQYRRKLSSLMFS